MTVTFKGLLRKSSMPDARARLRSSANVEVAAAAALPLAGCSGLPFTGAAPVRLVIKVPRTGHDVVFDDSISQVEMVIQGMADEFHILARQIGHHIRAALHHAHVPQVVEEVVADSRSSDIVQRHDAPGANVGGDVEVVSGRASWTRFPPRFPREASR